jgi:peptidyl-prolyl cis-trans isomerase C
MKKAFLSLFTSALLVTLPVLPLSAAEAPKLNAVIAEINGSKLTVADFQAYIRMRMRNSELKEPLNPAQREKIFGEYINRELLYQEALKKGLDQNEVIKAEIQNQRRNIIVSFALQQLMRSPLKESEIRAVYDKEIATPSREYKTRHILVKSEDEAKEIIKELEHGKNFSQLAMKHSIDASGKKGGELGWFSPQQMVEPYTEATKKLTNGSYTHTPVKTRFGWHIIRLDGTREVPPPAYEDVRDKIVTQINTRRISAYINELRKKADIVVAKNHDDDDGDGEGGERAASKPTQ